MSICWYSNSDSSIHYVSFDPCNRRYFCLAHVPSASAIHTKLNHLKDKIQTSTVDHYIVITTTFEKKSLVLLHFYGNKSYTILESVILSFIICVYNNVRQQKNNYGKRD